MLSFNTAFFIAKRYFVAQRREESKQTEHGLFRLAGLLLLSLFTFSPRRIKHHYRRMVNAFVSQNFIRILSNISMIGVGFGTAALIIVLSFFNGMEGVISGMFNRHNPEIIINPHKGKSFVYDKALEERILSTEGVAAITEVMQDNALLISGDKQKVVTLKGVSDNFALQTRIDTTVVLGEPFLKKDDVNYALVGSGIHYELSMRLKDRIRLLEFWYPKRKIKGSLSPETAFNRGYIQSGGVFIAEPQFDNSTVIVPMAFANNLFRYDNKRTALEIKTKDGSRIKEVQERLENLLGDAFAVKNRQQQQAHILRAMEIEKLFAFLTFAVILGIASFNVFFSLAMLTIEKKRDVGMLLSMGARKQMIRLIFLIEGSIIAFSGAGLGMLLGYGFCFLQDRYKLITTGAFGTMMDAYPVETRWTDFGIIGGVIILITMLAAIAPANNAAKTVIKDL